MGCPPQEHLQGLAVQKLPKYLEADEVAAMIRAADGPRARLSILGQGGPDSEPGSVGTVA